MPLLRPRFKHEMERQVDVHVAACVDSRDEFDDSPKEGVARAWERLEADLLASHVCSIQEAQVLLLTQSSSALRAIS